MGVEVRSGFIVIAAALLVASLSLSVFAADPGHAATSIGAGSFESGNYSFPDTLEIIRGLNVSNGLLYVDPTTNNVGIGTTSPAQKLNVGGSANVTGDVFLSTYGLLNCQGKLITDSTGNITCGTDATGSGGMDYTNVAMTNESNAFAAGYNQTFDTNTLFVDATGDKVGIGTDSPSTVLHVNGTFSVENTTGVQGLYQNAEGNVGIGTTSPGVVLDTAGTIRSTSMSTPTSGSGVEVRFSSETGFISAQNRSASTILPLKLYGNNVLINDAAGGNVGIGTTSPSFKLDVYGDTNTTGLLINATNCDSLDTNADGLIICGSDAAGSTGWSNVAFTNESNKFTVGQTIDSTLNVTGAPGITGLYVDGSGKVSIGTASTLGKLSIQSTLDEPLKETLSLQLSKLGVVNDNLTIMFYLPTGSGGLVGGTAGISAFTEDVGASTLAGALTFFTGNQSSGPERMRITSSGNVGVGTTSPVQTLNVIGDLNVTGTVYYHTLTAQSPIVLSSTDNKPSPICMKNSAGVWVGCLPDADNAWVCAPDDECNRNVIEMEAVRSLNGRGLNRSEIDDKVGELMQDVGGGRDVEKIRIKAKALGIELDDGVVGSLEAPQQWQRITSAGNLTGGPAAENISGAGGVCCSDVGLNVSELVLRVGLLEGEVALLKEEVANIKQGKADGLQAQKPEAPPQISLSPDGILNETDGNATGQAAEPGNDSDGGVVGGQRLTGLASAVARESRGLVWEWISGLIN